MPKSTKKQNDAIVKAIHTFSNEAFTLAKSLVGGSDAASLKEQASELKTKVPDFAAQMQEADPASRPDLNRVLSEARLDIEYVLADGKRPSSMRMAHVIREHDAAAQ